MLDTGVDVHGCKYLSFVLRISEREYMTIFLSIASVKDLRTFVTARANCPFRWCGHSCYSCNSTSRLRRMAGRTNPSDFLKELAGRPVVVKLNSGADYRGLLSCLDGYMNIALEQTEEYVNGQLKKKYGDAFIRGNNVLYISGTKTKK